MDKKLLKTLTTLLLLGTTLAAQAIDRKALSEYASSLKGQKKADLKTAVFNLIGNPKTLDYGSGYKHTWWGFYRTDRIGNTMECRNRYSDAKFYFTGDDGKSITGMNIEHSFPRSWWGGKKNKTPKAKKADTDLYHLYPSDGKANGQKSNYPMGIVTSGSPAPDGAEKVGSGLGPNGQLIRMFEPADQYKGDFSRGYMYMATTYQDLEWQGTQGLQELVQGEWPTLQEWAYKIYLKWIGDDPVDEVEIDRNNAVAEIQGNRNLFIDYPYLAEYIWGDSIDRPFDPYTSVTTASDDYRYGSQTPPAVTTPTFSVTSGSYIAPLTVEITCATTGATIYYTTDGTEPTKASTPYNAPLTLNATTTLKAIAVKGTDASSVATANYTLKNADDMYYFSKLTTAPTDGKRYLIVVNDGTLKAAKPVVEGTKGYGYLLVTDVQEKESKITLETDELAFTFEAAAGGFKIKDSKGRYYYQSGTYSTFTPTTDPTEADVWTVVKNDDGTYSIKAADSGNTIQYSTKFKSFGNYSTKAAANLFPMLYEETKSNGIATIEVETTGVNVNNATYTLQGVQMPQGKPLPPGIYIRNGRKIVVK